MLEIMDGSEDMVAYIHRIIGMCLTGDITEHVLPIFWGSGRNGKNTLLDTVSDILNDYAGQAAPTLIAGKIGQKEHPTEIADLYGKRLIVVSETDDDDKLRAQQVKRLTGDKTQKARFMRGDWFEFARTHKLILMTNKKPIVREDTTAMWSRLHLIPFTQKFTDENGRIDRALPDKLKTEFPGIFNRLIEGCLQWQKQGLNPPQKVTEATREYRSDSDVLYEYISACCDRIENISETAKKLYQKYSEWAEEEGYKKYEIMNKTTFGRRMSEQFTKDRKKGKTVYYGVACKTIFSQY